jgi:Phage tail tube protein
MARAYGSSAHLLMKRETTYGQAATGNYVRMPFNRCNLGSEQGLIDDPVLGQGRDPLAPLQDVKTSVGGANATTANTRCHLIAFTTGAPAARPTPARIVPAALCSDR